MSNDVYFQVGLLTTIGLAAKNAILIVEFAKWKDEAGKDLVEATLRRRACGCAHPDDLAGLHPRCVAAGARDRAGSGRSTRSGSR